MSASTDLVSLRDRVEQLEAELDRSRIDLDYSADETQEYKDECGKFQERCAELKVQYAELKVENKRLTRKLNEPNAHFASPGISSQSDEVVSLKRQLAGKEQVIAAQEKSFQSLLNLIKPVFNATLTRFSMLEEEAIQSCLAAMPKDAAQTLKAYQDEVAQRGQPSNGDANSSHDKPLEKSPTPLVPCQPQTSCSHNSSKTLVTQGATETPSEGLASKSESPKPGQEHSIEGPKSYSGVVTSQRAQAPWRGRPGQARVPIEVLDRQAALRAEKQEEIQSEAGRSQKPNNVGGFQPPQKAAGSSDIKASPAPKQNATALGSGGRSHTADFFSRDLESSLAAWRKATASDNGNRSHTADFFSEDLASSLAATREVTASGNGNRSHTADFRINRDLPSPSIPKPSSIGQLDSCQARDARFPPPARSDEAQPGKILSDTNGDDEEDSFLKGRASNRPFPGFGPGAVVQKPKSLESMPQKPVTQEQVCQILVKDTIDTAEYVPGWASEMEGQGNPPVSRYNSKYS